NGALLPRRQHGDGFNLVESAVDRELAHFQRGRGRWIGSDDMAVAHIAVDRQLGADVGQTIVELLHVFEAGADGSKRILQVFERLGGLGAKIAGWAGELALEGEPELSGDVDDAAWAG